jgi:alcohol dehydrogenase class IV
VFALKKLIHDLGVALGRVLAKLLPDRIPVTFVGADAARELCESIAQSGAGRVLVVSDAVLSELGLVRRITDALQAAGLASSVYDGVEPDPTYEHVEAGLARLEADGCDAVLALGGGSPMDAAKVIAASACNGGDARKLEGMMKVRRPPLPLYAIPTTAGTGSEVTYAAVVSDPRTHTKGFFVDPKLLPRMTALDPTLMTGLPQPVTAATGMDALTHAVESYLAKTATPQTKAWATCAVRLIFENLPKASADGADVAARKAMALASYYAGLAFTRTSVGYVHAIAHTFGAYYRTPHGWANAIALPHVLEFSEEPARARLAELADVIGAPGAGEAEKALRFIDAVRQLKARVGIPETLDALRAEDVPAIARQALAEAHLNYPVPRYMSQEQCEGLLGRMLAPAPAA